MTDEAVADGSPEAQRAPFWRRPPRRLFHLILVLPALVWLWAWSVPGFDFLLWMPSAMALGVGAVVWGVRLLTYLIARLQRQPTTGGRRFFVAPVCGAVALALVIADVPLKARWIASRSSFEDVVDNVLADDDFTFGDDQRLGLYTVIHVYREGDAVIFYERTGSFSDDAGFAYLPNGPFPELENGGFERPEFRHLGGAWYAWTASW